MKITLKQLIVLSVFSGTLYYMGQKWVESHEAEWVPVQSQFRPLYQHVDIGQVHVMRRVNDLMQSDPILTNDPKSYYAKLEKLEKQLVLLDTFKSNTFNKIYREAQSMEKADSLTQLDQIMNFVTGISHGVIMFSWMIKSSLMPGIYLFQIIMELIFRNGF